jgi:hypothetical protein
MALFPLGILSAAGAGGAPAGPSDYELITTEILGTSQASVTFNNLGDYSSTYKHLQVRVVSRSNRGAVFEDTLLRFNGSTSDYASHWLEGANGVVPSSNQGTSNSRMYIFGGTNGNNATANAFGATVIDILEPFNTTKNKIIRHLSGRIPESSQGVSFGSGLWVNTSSVTSFTILPDGGSAWVAGSRFSIYGIKG